MNQLVGSAWHFAKRWRTVTFGPVSLFMQLRKRQSLHHPRAVLNVPQRAEALIKKELPQAIGPALIVGTGPGLGYELAKRLNEEGISFGVAARNGQRLEQFLRTLESRTGVPFAVDATCETSVTRLFDDFEQQFSEPPRLLVYSVQESSAGTSLEVSLPAFEAALRSNCVGSFICAQQAAKRMVRAGRGGTIVLIGSTSSVIGRARHLTLAVGRFGQRALAQVMARELSSFGIHVVHLMIDADIRETEAVEASPQADPADIAEIIMQLHRQPRSAWTSELDCRPWNESFWEHC